MEWIPQQWLQQHEAKCYQRLCLVSHDGTELFFITGLFTTVIIFFIIVLITTILSESSSMLIPSSAKEILEQINPLSTNCGLSVIISAISSIYFPRDTLALVMGRLMSTGCRAMTQPSNQWETCWEYHCWNFCLQITATSNSCNLCVVFGGST